MLATRSIGGVSGSLFTQAIGVAAVFGYAMVMSALLLLVTQVIVGLRVDEQTEQAGLDIGQHRERLGT